MTRNPKINLPDDVARCAPTLPCERQHECARGAATIPLALATLTDFTQVAHGSVFIAALCHGFMTISYTPDPTPAPVRRVHPPLS